jgi:hypothetical protein
LGKDGYVRDVLLHEVDEEYLHIDYVFPTDRGIFLLDLIDYSGHVFGASTLRHWTILDRGRRHVLDNPLFSLQAKREAFRRLQGDGLRYESYLVFPENTTLGRDLPDNVLPVTLFFDRLLESGVLSEASEEKDSKRRSWEETKRKLREATPS